MCQTKIWADFPMAIPAEVKTWCGVEREFEGWDPAEVADARKWLGQGIPGYSRGWRPWGRGDQNCENWDGQSAQICLVCQGQKGLNKNYPCSKKGPIYSHLDHLVDSNFWFKDEHGTNNNNDQINPNRPDKKNIYLAILEVPTLVETIQLNGIQMTISNQLGSHIKYTWWYEG